MSMKWLSVIGFSIAVSRLLRSRVSSSVYTAVFVGVLSRRYDRIIVAIASCMWRASSRWRDLLVFRLHSSLTAFFSVATSSACVLGVNRYQQRRRFMGEHF